MAANSKAVIKDAAVKRAPEVKSILVSQPQPNHSPYFKLEEKYDIKIDWRPFIHVEAVSEKEFRKNRIRPDEFEVVIFTSKNAIEHYFRICQEMRIDVSQDMRYFCLTEAIANYLQKFIIYRKRKVFVGSRKIHDLETAFNKNKGKKFLLPCSNLGSQDVQSYLEDKNIDFQVAMMYRTVSSDLSDLSAITYDVLVFFSPLGIKSLYDNFPKFEQNETRLAIFGKSTREAVLDHGLEINIEAPTKENPSMTMALENYIKLTND